LDADDRLLPEAIELGLASLSARAECAFTAGRARVATMYDRLLWEEEPGRGARDYRDLLAGNCVKTPGVLLFRRSVFEEVGLFDPRMQACSDYEMYLRIARTHPICSHDGMVLTYRMHAGG